MSCLVLSLSFDFVFVNMSHYENNLAEKDLKRDLETDQHLTNTPSVAHGNQVHDDVFGEITDEGPNYRAVRLPQSHSQHIPY